jgi:DNA repair protein RecN (Recombination protein N)
LLRELRVRDLALVDEAQVRFGPGLNLLTGETGSGKSLIIDALGLALGARASNDQVRQGARRALAEARFETLDGDLVLGREVGRRSAARIDGALVGVAELGQMGSRLVAVHGQNEQQTLLDPDVQTLLLDTQAGALEARRAVAAAHADWREAVERLSALQQARARDRREEEYLRWQLDELRSIDPQPGEDERLTLERSVIRHGARLAELGEAALTHLRQDEELAAAAGAVRQASELDPSLHGLAERLEVLQEEQGDAISELRAYTGGIDADPARLEALESRLALLDQLKRKHGGTLEMVLAERDRLESLLVRDQDLGQAVEEAEQAVCQSRRRLEEAATELTESRRQGASHWSQVVTRELRGLHLADGLFEVGLIPRAEIGPEGAETIEMRFRANPHETPAALAKVASGGELSRVMLAIETAGAARTQVPTLVFDEVDAGIGGETAWEVGKRLERLGNECQVLVVTHLAQIACFADHHLVVEKRPGPDGRNLVRVRELASAEQRAQELARMMSGRVTDKALARAHELLEEAVSR